MIFTVSSGLSATLVMFFGQFKWIIVVVVRVVVVVSVADVVLAVDDLLVVIVTLATVADADLAVGVGFVIILGIGDVENLCCGCLMPDFIFIVSDYKMHYQYTIAGNFPCCRKIP